MIKAQQGTNLKVKTKKIEKPNKTNQKKNQNTSDW